MALIVIRKGFQRQEDQKDWSDALLVPIQKMGDMRKCYNWRGIALLDVVGKLNAQIIQERLQTLVEEELPESRCGLRKGVDVQIWSSQ